MARKSGKKKIFNVVAVGQNCHLGYEAMLFAALLRHHSSSFEGNLLIAEPHLGRLWPNDPRMKPDVREALEGLDVLIIHFESKHFGASYAYGNKIEMLASIPRNEPFVFFDTDTLLTDNLLDVPFNFDRPSAYLRRENTWPKPPLYGPDYSRILNSLYDKFGLDFDTSLDLSEPDEYWKHYIYFNAGFFYYNCLHAFGEKFLEYALAVRDEKMPELACQELTPWLDRIVLTLVVHALGGGRDALPEGYLDGKTSFHYRMFP